MLRRWLAPLVRVAPLGALAAASACSGARYEGTAQGPALTMPARFAEGTDQGDESAADGGFEAGDDAGRRRPDPGDLPDPEALREARQYEYEVVYDRGAVRVERVRALRFPKPVVTGRMMGRFAIELWIGHELVDRVRFDFPLVAAEDIRRKKARPLNEGPSFAKGVIASQKVLVPASPRATRALLVDRGTGERWILPWPPEAPLGPARTELPRKTPDAGPPDAGPAGSEDAAAPAPEGGASPPVHARLAPP